MERDIKLVIFDFDGTLADTKENIILTFQMTMKELEVEIKSRQECAATIGLTLEDAFKVLYPGMAAEKYILLRDTYRRIFKENRKILVPGLFPEVMETLEELRRRVGEEKWSDMEEFHRDYWGMRQRAIAKLTGSEAYSEELNEKMWDNEWYATRKTLSHVLPKSALVGIGNGPSARIHAVKGSFEGTSNPMTETVLNDIRLMEGATLNRIKMQTVDLLKDVPEAAVRVNDLKSETPNGFTRVKLWRSGRFESWDIDDVYAGGLRNILDGKMTSAAVKWLSAVNNVWRKGLTSYSPSFILKNPLRDFDETFKNLPRSSGNSVADDLSSWMRSWISFMKFLSICPAWRIIHHFFPNM